MSDAVTEFRRRASDRRHKILLCNLAALGTLRRLLRRVLAIARPSFSGLIREEVRRG